MSCSSLKVWRSDAQTGRATSHPIWVSTVVIYSPEEGIAVYIDFYIDNNRIQGIQPLRTTGTPRFLAPGSPVVTKGSHMMGDESYCALAVCCRIAAVCWTVSCHQIAKPRPVKPCRQPHTFSGVAFILARRSSPISTQNAVIDFGER